MDKRKNKTQKLRRRQLDSLYGKLHSVTEVAIPSGGWIREIREALGISSLQFAKRLRISRQAFQKLEASEQKQSIELNTLRRVAEAMDCRVVYVVLPNSPEDTLESLLQSRALKIATEFVGKVSRSMGLEDQAISKKERDQQIREFAEELIGNLDKRLWDVD